MNLGQSGGRVYNNGFWLNNSKMSIGNNGGDYVEGPGWNIGIDNNEGATIDFYTDSISLGIESGQWMNSGTINLSGDISTQDPTGLEQGVPMIINWGLLNFGDDSRVNVNIYNNGYEGDGSGISGSPIFVADLLDRGNLLPGYGSTYGTITFQQIYNGGGVAINQKGKAHEFHLSAELGGDQLVSIQGVNLSIVAVLDVIFLDGTPPTNYKRTIFQSKQGAGNTSGNYNDSDLRPCQEGDQITYTAQDGDTNVPIFITYSGGAGSDIELYGSTYNYDKGSASADVLTGTEGSDTYQGLAGDDKLVSSGGVDDVYGGTGADHFVFSKGDGHMVIHDFNEDEDRYSALNGQAMTVVNKDESAHVYIGSDLVGTIHDYESPHQFVYG